MNTGARIVESINKEAPFGQIKFLFLPQGDFFARRAKRLIHLSQGHLMGDYLVFAALLADAQQDTLSQFLALSLNPEKQVPFRQDGTPLLDARSHPRKPAWRQGLKMILQRMREADLPRAARDAVASLLQRNEIYLEEMANSILAGNLDYISPQELPLVAAGLQVYWVHMASSLGEDAFGRLKECGKCPVCGSYPVAGTINIAGVRQGLRYLSCSLCASEWHMVRIKCTICESTDGINYYTLEGSNGAVKAESCGKCNFYLKLLYLDKDAQMETVADDLATLALDMLMDREGKVRGGPNLLFHPGKSH